MPNRRITLPIINAVRPKQLPTDHNDRRRFSPSSLPAPAIWMLLKEQSSSRFGARDT